METKKLGFLIIGMSIVLGFIIFNFMDSLSLQSNKMQCNPTHECKQINSVLGISHIAVGFLAFIFALGFYLLFFNKDEKEILEKYGFNQHSQIPSDKSQNLSNNFASIKNAQNTNNQIINQAEENSKSNEINNRNSDLDKFSMLLRPLDDSQKKVLMAIKEQEGITQSTLRFRTDLSKAKVSMILTDFEKKNLIERKAKGKTYAVFLAENF